MEIKRINKNKKKIYKKIKKKPKVEANNGCYSNDKLEVLSLKTFVKPICPVSYN